MLAEVQIKEDNRFARCIEISKRVRWDIASRVIAELKFPVGAVMNDRGEGAVMLQNTWVWVE